MKVMPKVNVLINTYGIVDSGGARVFEKLLNELSASPSCQCHIVCSRDGNLDYLMSRYITYTNVHFIITPNQGLLYRFYYENFTFRRIINKKDIQLIYNFSDSYQIFTKTPQLLTVQNLLFYSKKLDLPYQHQAHFFLWIRHVCKRLGVYFSFRSVSLYLFLGITLTVFKYRLIEKNSNNNLKNEI